MSMKNYSRTRDLPACRAVPVEVNKCIILWTAAGVGYCQCAIYYNSFVTTAYTVSIVHAHNAGSSLVQPAGHVICTVKFCVPYMTSLLHNFMLC
jgi:hypothetical protein